MINRLLFLLGPVIPIALNLIAFGVLNRIMASVELRNLILTVTCGQVIGMALTWGTPAAFTKQYFDADSRCRALKLTFFVLAVSAIGIATLFGAAAWIAATERWHWGWLVPGYALVVASSVILQAIARALRCPIVFVTLSASTVVIPPGLAAWWASQGSWTPTAQLVSFSSSSLVFLGAWGVLWRRVRPDLDSNVRLADCLASLRRLGLPTIPHALSLFAVPAALRTTASVFGERAVVVCHAAMQIGGAPLTLLGALNNSWAIDIYEESQENRRGFIQRSFDLFTVVGVLAAALVASAGSIATSILLGPQYRDATAVVMVGVIALAAVICPVYLAHVNYLIGLGRVTWLALLTPGSLALAWLMAFGLSQASGGIAFLACLVPGFYLVLTVALGRLIRRETGAALLTAAHWRRLLGAGSLVVLLTPLNYWLYDSAWYMWLASFCAVVCGVLLAAAIVMMARKKFRPWLFKGALHVAGDQVQDRPLPTA